MKISQKTFRRFILGKQGLWPGRRWQGLSGTEEAMRAIEFLQLDPLHIIARAHDLILNSRVQNYQTEYLYQIAYEQRKFFDWGHWLAFRPIEEFPFWKREMDFTQKIHQTLPLKISSAFKLKILNTLKSEGPKGNRDFIKQTKVESYRGRKESAVALFRLWMEGKVLTTTRKNFERVYDLAENVLPPELFEKKQNEKLSNEFYLLKSLRFLGIDSLKSNNVWMPRHFTKLKQKETLTSLLHQNKISTLKIESESTPYYTETSNLKILEILEKGEIPKEWIPLQKTTKESVLFLSPLDIVCARGRAKKIFQFDYVWEVYKPASQRKWGYYTLPILWEDQLVARIDPKFDKKTKTLEILGFWVEDDSILKNDSFKFAFKNGLHDFMSFLGAQKVILNRKNQSRSFLFLKNLLD